MSERYREVAGRWLQSRPITHGDSGSVVLPMRIAADTFVDRLVVVVTEPFSTAGALQVGDADDADCWVAAADVGTMPATYHSEPGGAAAYAGGHLYTAERNLTVTVAPGLTSGEAFILAHVAPLGS